MSGGGKSKGSKMTPVPQTTLDTTSWGGMGYDLPGDPMKMGSEQAGQGLAPPSWAQGAWAMPWWGQQAPNVGMAMLQQQGWGPYANGGNPAQGGAYGAARGGPGGPGGPQAPRSAGKAWGGPRDARDYHLWEQMGKPGPLEWMRSPYGGDGAIDWGPNGGNG